MREHSALRFRQQEMFDQEFFYIPTRIFCHCQEFTKKHYIVAIKRAGIWGCRGVDNFAHKF
jgi:hypothetical protein